MVRRDIIAGLKNAVERGESLEKAKQSFISAGYPPAEVEAASRFVHAGVLTPISEKEKLPLPRPQPPTQSALQKSEKSIRGKIKRNFKIISLIVLLAILIAIFILTLIFRENIISWFV